jgi:hypothetical protein
MSARNGSREIREAADRRQRLDARDAPHVAAKQRQLADDLARAELDLDAACVHRDAAVEQDEHAAPT